jgi:hypothetical protein
MRTSPAPWGVESKYLYSAAIDISGAFGRKDHNAQDDPQWRYRLPPAAASAWSLGKKLKAYADAPVHYGEKILTLRCRFDSHNNINRFHVVEIAGAGDNSEACNAG